MKRILMTVSAFALSGCGILGGQSDYNHAQGYNYSQSTNSYSVPHSNNYGQQGASAHQQSGPVNFQGKHQHSRDTTLEVSMGVEEFMGGNIVPFSMGNGTVQKIGFDEAFGVGLRGSAGIAQNIAPKTTLLARGFYKHAQSVDDEIVIFEGSGGNTVSAGFGNYESYGAEIGFREYLTGRKSKLPLRPYLGGTVGFAHVNALEITSLQSIPTAIELNDSDWVPTASAMVGFEAPVSKRFSVGLETGLRYEGKRDSDAIPTPTSGAYSIPVSLRGSFNF